MPALMTLGQIAAQTGQPLHRVEYVVRSRPIAPTARVGNLRAYDEEAVRRIAAELAAIVARRSRP